MSCEREGEVLDALEGGIWATELQEHAADCADCGELLLVAGTLRHHAATVDDDRELPDPGFIWWRAQLHARADAVERATRVITIAQRVAVGCAALVAVSGIIRFWPQMKTLLSKLKPAIPSADMADPGLVIAASLGVIGLLLIFEVWEPSAED